MLPDPVPHIAYVQLPLLVFYFPSFCNFGSLLIILFRRLPCEILHLPMRRRDVFRILLFGNLPFQSISVLEENCGFLQVVPKVSVQLA